MSGTYVETRVVSLNSQSATMKKNGTFLSSLRFEIGQIIKDDPDIIHRSINISNAQFPVSFYIVNYTNNVFVLRNNTTTTNYTITIPVGNYNSTTLATAISAAVLSTASITITCSISTTTGLYTFSSATNFSILSTNALTTAHEILGLSTTANLVSTFSTTYTAVAPYPLNLLGIKKLCIKSNTLITNNFSAVAGGQTTLLCTIPVSTGAWGMIQYEDYAGSQITISNNTLDEIEIDICDAETDKYINFNNCNWTITILVQLTRKVDLSYNRPILGDLTHKVGETQY